MQLNQLYLTSIIENGIIKKKKKKRKETHSILSSIKSRMQTSYCLNCSNHNIQTHEQLMYLPNKMSLHQA
jgi:hypothetical protein